MQQRLAIAQALMMRPRILLLDEPFGALDPGIRQDMHVLIDRLWQEQQLTIFMITHDLKEAFELGTRLWVFDKTRHDPRRRKPMVPRSPTTCPFHATALRTSSKKRFTRADCTLTSRRRCDDKRCHESPTRLRHPLTRRASLVAAPAPRHHSYADGQTGRQQRGTLCYNPENLLERLNLPDTLKCQHTFKLTQGHCLYSDMGRIFASMTHDDLGWHDSVGGNLMPQHLLNKGWQPVSYQQAHNHWTRTGFDAFLVELAKYGLGRRDMAANLNLFSRVESDDEGKLRYVPGHRQPGNSVTLRFEMDTLVLLHTCPHPLDPAADYPRRGVDIALGTAAAPTEDDPCYRSRPENARGFANNRLYHLGL